MWKMFLTYVENCFHICGNIFTKAFVRHRTAFGRGKAVLFCTILYKRGAKVKLLFYNLTRRNEKRVKSGVFLALFVYKVVILPLEWELD